MFRLTDLREILRYVPQFRDRVFVIAMDGAVVEDDNFGNLLLDIALLRSLRIGVALVHGAGHQVRRLAEQTGKVPSNLDGTGVTDAVAVEVARTLRAAKLIYLTTTPGVEHEGELLRHLSVEEAEAVLKKERAGLPAPTLSKLSHAVRAARGGVPRVHIIDGRVEE